MNAALNEALLTLNVRNTSKKKAKLKRKESGAHGDFLATA
jgi:hypothetical protein